MKLIIKHFQRTLFILSMFIFSVSMYAQKAANTLYNKGIAAQKVMTIESQEEAIEYFEKAKKAYDSKANKAKCDAAIGKSKKIIDEDLDPDTLALDNEGFHFKESSAPGYVNVLTNREDWNVKLKTTEGGAEFAIAQKTDDGKQIKISCLDNKTYQDRVAVFEVTAGKLTKEIKVEQAGLHVNFAVQETSIDCKKKGGNVTVFVGSDCKETYSDNNGLKWHVISKPDWVEVSSSTKPKASFKENLKNIFKGPDEPLVANGEISIAKIMFLAIDKNAEEYGTGRLGEIILESGNRQITIKLHQK